MALDRRAAALSELRETVPLGYKDYATEFAREICEESESLLEESKSA